MWKWKYEELKQRYHILEQQTIDLSKEYAKTISHATDLKLQKELLVNKCTSIRVRRMKMVERVPKTAYEFRCRETKAELRKLYLQAPRSEILEIQKREWDKLSKDKRERVQNDFMMYTKRIQADRGLLVSATAQDTGAASTPKEQTKRTTPKKARKPYTKKKPSTKPSTTKKRVNTKVQGAISDKSAVPQKKARIEKVEEEEVPIEEEESQSSAGASDEDSDDQMAQLPTGAFG